MAVALYAPFITALHQRLANDAVLLSTPLNDNSSLGVYDVPVPQNDQQTSNIYPYITTGDIQADVDDDKTADGLVFNGFVHCFSRYQGSKEWLQVLDRVRVLLHHQCLAVTGGSNWLIITNLLTNFTEPDGFTRHGVLRYSASVSEE